LPQKRLGLHCLDWAALASIFTGNDRHLQSRPSIGPQPSLSCRNEQPTERSSSDEQTHHALHGVSVSVLATARAGTGGGAGSIKPAPRVDVAYYQSLVDKYATYVGLVGGTLSGSSERSALADLEAKVAIAQCQEINTGPAFPVLEQKLRDASVAVPPCTA